MMTTLEDDEPKYEALGICSQCRHRLTTSICQAFPKGIPFVILTGDFDHHYPYPGDHNIQFELLPTSD